MIGNRSRETGHALQSHDLCASLAKSSPPLSRANVHLSRCVTHGTRQYLPSNRGLGSQSKRWEIGCKAFRFAASWLSFAAGCPAAEYALRFLKISRCLYDVIINDGKSRSDRIYSRKIDEALLRSLMEIEFDKIFAVLMYGIVAGDAQAADVDAAIVFAVDVSSSVDQHTAEFQREGHAEALRAPEVINAIIHNRIGCIAITYFEWSDRGRMQPVLPWTSICGMSDGKNAASVILNNKLTPMGGGTSISYAMDEGRLLLDRFEGTAAIKVIDVAGNGTNNDGSSVDESRSRALQNGYTINAIVLPAYTRGIRYDLTDYFAEHVIGGPNAFVIAPKDKQQYGAALRRKLVREISSSPTDATTVMAILR